MHINCWKTVSTLALALALSLMAPSLRAESQSAPVRKSYTQCIEEAGQDDVKKIACRSSGARSAVVAENRKVEATTKAERTLASSSGISKSDSSITVVTKKASSSTVVTEPVPQQSVECGVKTVCLYDRPTTSSPHESVPQKSKVYSWKEVEGATNWRHGIVLVAGILKPGYFNVADQASLVIYREAYVSRVAASSPHIPTGCGGKDCSPAKVDTVRIPGKLTIQRDTTLITHTEMVERKVKADSIVAEAVTPSGRGWLPGRGTAIGAGILAALATYFVVKAVSGPGACSAVGSMNSCR